MFFSPSLRRRFQLGHGRGSQNFVASWQFRSFHASIFKGLGKKYAEGSGWWWRGVGWQMSFQGCPRQRPCPGSQPKATVKPGWHNRAHITGHLGPVLYGTELTFQPGSPPRAARLCVSWPRAHIHTALCGYGAQEADSEVTGQEAHYGGILGIQTWQWEVTGGEGLEEAAGEQGEVFIIEGVP